MLAYKIVSWNSLLKEHISIFYFILCGNIRNSVIKLPLKMILDQTTKLVVNLVCGLKLLNSPLNAEDPLALACHFLRQAHVGARFSFLFALFSNPKNTTLLSIFIICCVGANLALLLRERMMCTATAALLFWLTNDCCIRVQHGKIYNINV